ncbi:unnamed protein product, partial [Prorocentrum cordatum]
GRFLCRTADTSSGRGIKITGSQRGRRQSRQYRNFRLTLLHAACSTTGTCALRCWERFCPPVPLRVGIFYLLRTSQQIWFARFSNWVGQCIGFATYTDRYRGDIEVSFSQFADAQEGVSAQSSKVYLLPATQCTMNMLIHLLLTSPTPSLSISSLPFSRPPKRVHSQSHLVISFALLHVFRASPYSLIFSMFGRFGGRGKCAGKQNKGNYYHHDRGYSGSDRMNQYLVSELESERAANASYREREEAATAEEQQASVIAGVAKKTTRAMARMMGFRSSSSKGRGKKEKEAKSKSFGFTKAGMRALRKMDSSTSEGPAPSSLASSTDKSESYSMRFMSKIARSMQSKWKKQKQEEQKVKAAKRLLKKHGVPIDDNPSPAPKPNNATLRKKLKLPEDEDTVKQAVYQEVLDALSPESDMTDWPKTDPEWAAALASEPKVTLPKIQKLLIANGLSTSAKSNKPDKICQILEHLRS